MIFFPPLLFTKSVHRNCFRSCVLQHRPLLIGFHAVIRFTHTIVSIPGWSWCCARVKSCGVSGLYPILLFWPPEASGGWAVFHQTYLNKSLWDNTPLKFKDKYIPFVLSFNSWCLLECKPCFYLRSQTDTYNVSKKRKHFSISISETQLLYISGQFPSLVIWTSLPGKFPNRSW